MTQCCWSATWHPARPKITDDLHRYASRLSGPLLDRIDLYVQAERLTAEELTGAADAEPTARVRARVLAARDVQRRRQGAENGRLAVPDLATHCQVTSAARRTLMAAVDRLGLSARGFHRALRVARTVADLAATDRVEDHHVKEALSLRATSRSSATVRRSPYDREVHQTPAPDGAPMTGMEARR